MTFLLMLKEIHLHSASGTQCVKVILLLSVLFSALCFVFLRLTSRFYLPESTLKTPMCTTLRLCSTPTSPTVQWPQLWQRPKEVECLLQHTSSLNRCTIHKVIFLFRQWRSWMFSDLVPVFSLYYCHYGDTHTASSIQSHYGLQHSYKLYHND